MKRTRKTMENADKVFDVLATLGPMSARDLCNITGLTKDQVERSVRVAKETLAGTHEAPIIYDSRANTYQLDADLEAVVEYKRQRGTIHLTQLLNLMTGTVEPALAKFGESFEVRMARKSLNRAIEDLEELVL